MIKKRRLVFGAVFKFCRGEKYFRRAMSRVLFVAAFVFPLLATKAYAGVTNWTGSTSTDWNTAGNWDSNTVPTGGDFVHIDLANGPVITAPNAAGIDVYVGLTANGGLTIQGGGKLNNQSSILGDGADVQGTATVTGAGSSWIGSGNFYAGKDGQGTLTVENGASLSNFVGYIGFGSGGVGTVTVTGSGTSWTNTGNIGVGEDGHGTLTVENGATLSDVTGIVGDTASSVGIMTVSGAGTHWTNSGNVGIGESGNGTLTLENGAALSDVIGIIGDSSGSVGTATASGSGTSWTNSGNFYVGYIGNGTFTLENGATLSAAVSILGVDAAATGMATVSGPGTSWTSSGNFAVGEGGHGTLILENGATISNAVGAIGDNSGSVGTATVTGSGTSWTNSGDLYVGGFSINVSTGTLTVADSATVSAGSGSGTVHVANWGGSTGTVNIGAASGNTAVAPGTISASTIAFGSGNAVLNFNHTSANYSFAPTISGGGTINSIAGTTILTGDSSSFSGTTNISGGKLQIGDAGHTGAKLGSTINISGGSLAGHGTVGGNVNNTSGTTAPGGSVGTLTVSGNYTQGSSGTLSIEINPSAASKLDIGGTATLGGALVVSPDSGTYTQGTSYTILNAGGGISGTFSSVSFNTSGFSPFNIDYGTNAITLTLNTVPNTDSFLSNAVGSNQAGVASALDTASAGVSSGPFHEAVATISGLDVYAQEQALTQLSGLAAASLASNVNASTSATMNTVQSRLGGGLGASSFSLSSGIGEAAEIQLADADPFYWGPPRSSIGGYSAWVQGFGEFQSVGSSQGVSGYSNTLGGGAFGLERHNDPQNVVGAVFTAAQSWSGATDVPQTSKVNTYSAGVYGRHDWESLFVDGTILFAYSHATSKRTIVALDQTANGATDGFTGGVNTGVGVPIPFGSDETTTLTPRADFSYSYNHWNGYSETGAPGVNLDIGSNNQQLFKTTVGATLASKLDVSFLDDSVVRPEVRLGWRHDWLNPQTLVSESFAGIANSSFTTKGNNLARDAALAGIGLSVESAELPSFVIYARYDGAYAASEADNAFTAGVRYSW